MKTQQNLKEFVEKLRPIMESLAKELDLELIDVIVSKGLVRCIADKPGGIHLDDCAKLSRSVSVLFDEYETRIKERYSLEISSPGLYRPLTQAKHFDRVIGERVALYTYRAKEGRKKFTGILKDCRGDHIVLETDDGTSWTLTRDEICKAHLEPTIDINKIMKESDI